MSDSKTRATYLMLILTLFVLMVAGTVKACGDSLDCLKDTNPPTVQEINFYGVCTFDTSKRRFAVENNRSTQVTVGWERDGMILGTYTIPAKDALYFEVNDQGSNVVKLRYDGQEKYAQCLDMLCSPSPSPSPSPELVSPISPVTPVTPVTPVEPTPLVTPSPSPTYINESGQPLQPPSRAPK